MTFVLEVMSIAGATLLVGTICVLVHRIDVTLRSAAESVHAIQTDSRSMQIYARSVSPGIEAMNQNLYVVAVHLAHLGDAAESLSDGSSS